MTIIERILLELCAKDVVEDGMPDFTNEKHLLALNEVLVELDWPMEARGELLYTLMEKEDKYPAVSVDDKDGTKKTVYFKSKEKRDDAIKAGTHEKSPEKDPDDSDDEKQSSDTKVTNFDRPVSEKEDEPEDGGKQKKEKSISKENQKKVNFLKNKVEEARNLLDEDKQKLVDECIEKIETLYDDNASEEEKKEAAEWLMKNGKFSASAMPKSGKRKAYLNGIGVMRKILS